MAVQPIKNSTFISSTGVYPPHTGEYDESSEVLVDHAVALAEREVQQWETTTAYCAAAVGRRTACDCTLLVGKVLEEADQPVNWVHRDDVIGASNFLEVQAISGIFNVVAPLHPERRWVARQQSERYGFAPPAQETEGGKRRIIHSKVLLELVLFSSTPTRFLSEGEVGQTRKIG